MKQIFAQRLRSARSMAGLSLQNLAQKLEVNSVTRQALHKYESGISLPGSAVLLALSEALNVTPDYFFRTNQVNLEQVEFRKKSRLGVKEEAKIKEMVKEKVQKYHEIEEILNKSQRFVNPLNNTVVEGFAAAEALALNLRHTWDIGLNPIPNILEMLENKGIKVIEIVAPPEFDGMSALNGNVPVLVLNKNMDDVRKRFTAIHELGHLILKFPETSTKTEKLCHYFAAAFLVPESQLKSELGHKRRRIANTELIALKEYWGISVQALMKRIFDLQIIPESQYKNFVVWISKNRLRDEIGLGDYKGVEKAWRFEQMVNHALAEELISMSKASELSDVPLHELRSNFQIA